MSFWELLALGSVIATVLGVFVTLYGMINNRTLKEESKITREMIRQEFGGTRELLSKIEQGQSEARKEMAEALRYLADLIRLESETSRELIKSKP
jgi:hypothetical protein